MKKSIAAAWVQRGYSFFWIISGVFVFCLFCASFMEYVTGPLTADELGLRSKAGNSVTAQAYESSFEPPMPDEGEATEDNTARSIRKYGSQPRG